MRYEPMRPGPRQPQILVASAPGDPRAIRLVDDLLAMGWQVILADTPELAEELAPSAICIAVLRPRYWNAPPIAATVRANPPYLIPVMAEPMALPRGPWSFEPIPMESPRQVADEVADALEDGFRALSWRRPSRPNPMPRDAFSARRGDEFGARSMPSRPSLRAAAVSPLAPLPAKKASGSSRTVGGVISLLVIAGLLFGGYKFGLISDLKKILGKSVSSTPIATQPVSYTTNLPGPNCDKGGGKWEALTDSTLAGMCQSNGFLLTKSGAFDTTGEIFFDGKDLAPFPASYQVQVTATIVAGDANAGVGVELHRQTPQGGQIFDVQSNQWIMTLNDKSGVPARRLALGFFPKSTQTFVLSAVVTGGMMTLSINNVQVDTVMDGTYATTDTIALVLADPGAKKAALALFTQFTYTPLKTPALAPTAVAATATAQATALTPYSAASPGPGCDKGKGQWNPYDYGNSASVIKCLSNGLQVALSGTAAAGGNPAEVKFYDLDGNFPANYKIAVTVDMSNINLGGAGIFLRTKDGVASYHVYVFSNGSWDIRKNDLTQGTSSTLNAGNFALNTNAPVQLVVAISGTTISLTINGTTVSTTKDVTTPALTSTDDISLALNGAGSQAALVFSNFTFTPLP